jgi:hypothetical protein
VLRVPTAAAIAPGGAVFVAGSNSTQSAAVIEWWPPDDPEHSAVLTVPGSDVRQIDALAAASSTQLFVAGVRRENLILGFSIYEILIAGKRLGVTPRVHRLLVDRRSARVYVVPVADVVVAIEQ